MSYIPSPSTSYSSPVKSNFSSYICPSTLEKDGNLKNQKKLDSELLGWIKEAKEEGNTYLKQCRAYSDIDKAIDLIVSQVQNDLPTSISQQFVPTIKRDIREMVAILANIRPSWIYEPRAMKDKTWIHQASIQNGLSKDWYESNFVDRKLKSLLQLALVEGTGYLSPIWNPNLYGQNIGGIEIKLYRYDEVLPIQMPRDFNIQKAYATVLVDEMGINLAREVFYTKAHLLVPDRGQSKLGRGLVQTAAQTFTESILGRDNPKKNLSSGPVVDIFYIYVNDFSVNPTPSSMTFGEGSWQYTVPSIGSQIPNGYNKDGSLQTKKASVIDSKLYPNKRLIIATNTAILYDGPSFWWHGKTPIIKYSPDEWIFSYLGFSLASEVSSLQTSAIKMRRALEDSLHLTIDPPLAADKSILSKKTAESSSIRTPGRRIYTNLAMGDMVKPILNPTFYKPTSEHFNMVKEVEDKISFILGLPDLKALQQAKQVPNSDSIEKFFSQAGAIVTDMSRSMDKPIWEMADMNRYYFYQFYTLEDRIKILGIDGQSEEDFDFAPGTLIPESLPNEPKINIGNNERDDIYGIFLSTEIERARQHINNFKTSIHPTSLHQITHMQRKMLHMQASKINPLLISVETLAKTLDIENWGHLEGETELAKKLSEMKIQEKFQLKTKFDGALLDLLIQKLAQSESPEGKMTNAMEGIASAIKGDNSKETTGEGSSNGSGGGNVGRPPSLQSPPTLVNKGDRTTVDTGAK